MTKTDVRGLKFDNVTRAEAMELARSALASNGSATVFTPNAEIAYNASRDRDFFNVLSSADILLPDGAGILKAAKILDSPLKEKVAGVDFGLDVASICAEGGYSLYLLGGKPNIAKKAAENLTERFSGLTIAGVHDGYFDKKGEENDDVITQINASAADVIFVCFGSPAQERWSFENKDKLKDVRLICALGGSIDVYAGAVKRAPNFFIKTNTEWLYRLIKQPKRLGRMMSLPKYIRDTKKYKKRRGK